MEWLILSSLGIITLLLGMPRPKKTASLVIKWLFIKPFYRLQLFGLENIPQAGPALLVPNYLTGLDALLLWIVVPRRIKFIAREKDFKKWWRKPFLAILPFTRTPEENENLDQKLIAEAYRQLSQGELVCFFLEEHLTRQTLTASFQQALEENDKAFVYPLIPLYADCRWGKLIAFQKGRFFISRPKQASSLTIIFGNPLRNFKTAWEIRQAIEALGYEALMKQKIFHRPIHHLFIRNVKRAPWRLALADDRHPHLSRLNILAAAVIIARRLKPACAPRFPLGILLPTSLPACLVNLAATLSGRPAVNLNHTAGAAALSSVLEQAGIKTIVTSRKMESKMPFPLPADRSYLYVEDLAEGFHPLEKIIACLLSLFGSIRQIEKACGSTQASQVDDILTIIFTSGSTGNPKGVLLSHFNLASNVESVSLVTPSKGHQDKLLGILPLFHAFGYMHMWLGLNHCFGTVVHHDPFDAVKIGSLIEKHRINIVMTTPTFLKNYLRRIQPQQFNSVHCVLTGAEKLPLSLSEAFEKRFGIHPIEGYGATECSPVIATNTLDGRYLGVYQSGAKTGTVGQAVPGVLIRIVHPETFEDLPCLQPGLLLVKGPNIMQGYLGREDLSRQALKDGWYLTNDLASMDEAGYITIIDRLSRFSKIGGEMIPHGRIEEALQQAACLEELSFAVTSIPCERKGESLVVVHTLQPGRIPFLIKELADQGIPNLFIPHPNHFIHVQELPLLGSGKLDLKAIKAIALQTAKSD